MARLGKRDDVIAPETDANRGKMRRLAEERVTLRHHDAAK